MKGLWPCLCLSLAALTAGGVAAPPLPAPVPVPEAEDASISKLPEPYSFSYAAGRFPNHVDRAHAEVSDGSGVVRGRYSWVDPRFQVRTVEYVADEHGFHPVLSSPVADTPAVAAAKQRHADLFERIAAQHARIAAERAAQAEVSQHALRNEQ